MTAQLSSDTTEVQQWLRARARPVRTEADIVGADLEPLIARLAEATVVGIGESTRFSRQTFGVRERIFRTLVQQHGFRALAIQDGARSGDRLDAYVRTGQGDPTAALGGAWRPWRTVDMVAALDWIRAFNEQHPDDPVTVFGIEPPAAEPADYDAVLDHVREHVPDALAQLRSHLEPIRTAHRVDEHVQRHQGIHPGRPFVEHARDALRLIEHLSVPEAIAARMRMILDFHQHSVAGQGGFARDERRSAETIIERQRRTGAKIVYWDGIGHIAGSDAGVGRTDPDRFRGAGVHLRAEFGERYRAVAVGFHHGDLGLAIAPDPAPELIDAQLGAVDLPAFFVDLHGDAPEPVDRWRRGPAKLRTISGVYDPAKDDEAFIAVDSLADAFDALIHIRAATPVEWLPEFAA
ncbi:erythromycin esterase family protein [Nocardia cyriacigeorgica]|uniref:erythromycin esterase family protein n=1 Tax=Nocardia cyriacigeorgica TaxID=135487 RepID=UPI0018939581|nr:erythromycin esterase family protein [Nocardia cyriacigeorgica]MBF6342663.1 erythromycin esterase family protein [Nocardia cyriacigeorgica]MBF6514979.1 erythromycin esterase family protein [Nocardia cyriacigeorgica]